MLWFHSGRKKTEHLNICLNSLYSVFLLFLSYRLINWLLFVSAFFSSRETQLWWSDFKVRTADARDYGGNLGSAWNNTKLFLLQEKSSRFFLCTRAEQSFVVRWIVNCLFPFENIPLFWKNIQSAGSLHWIIWFFLSTLFFLLLWKIYHNAVQYAQHRRNKL